MTLLHYAGAVLVIALIVGVGVYSGRKVSAADFTSGGGKAGAAVIAGMIMGTLVGGSSTIGTAQLAFTYGMSAWWFTLGGGIGCLMMGAFYIHPLRASGCPTLVGIIGKEYGAKTGMAASILSSVGIFINIISQLISATAVIAIIFPNLGIVPALAIAVGLMAVYVVCGGALGAGMVGVVKLILLYASVALGAILALRVTGFGTLYQTLDHATFFNLFARGLGTDGANGLSLILGLLTTQTYAQAVMAGKSDRAARKGAFISALFIPPIGAGGIVIGEFMRVNHPELASAKAAFPQFVVQYMPPVLGGVVIATLLIAVVGTGAGLALGISTIINKDIVKKMTDRFNSPAKEMLFTRVCILAVLAAACLFSTGAMGDMILNFAFMSMGLRGAVIFVPLCCALWLPGRISSKWVMAAVVTGPLCVLVFGVVKVLNVDSLFLGMAASLICCAIGGLARRNVPVRLNREN